MIYAYKGEKRFCAFCGDLLWQWSRDVYAGEVASISQLEPGVGQEFKMYETMRCNKCQKGIDINHPNAKFEKV